MYSRTLTFQFIVHPETWTFVLFRYFCILVKNRESSAAPPEELYNPKWPNKMWTIESTFACVIPVKDSVASVYNVCAKLYSCAEKLLSFKKPRFWLQRITSQNETDSAKQLFDWFSDATCVEVGVSLNFCTVTSVSYVFTFPLFSCFGPFRAQHNGAWFCKLRCAGKITHFLLIVFSGTRKHSPCSFLSVFPCQDKKDYFLGSFVTLFCRQCLLFGNGVFFFSWKNLRYFFQQIQINAKQQFLVGCFCDENCNRLLWGWTQPKYSPDTGVALLSLFESEGVNILFVRKNLIYDDLNWRGWFKACL